MIAFSGIDCSGKSTQIDLVCKLYKEKNIKCQVVWSRGGYTPGIEFIKKLLGGRKSTISNQEHITRSENINSNPKKRKILFLAGLIDLWGFYSIGLRLKEAFGTRVICDRYIWDTYIDYKMKYPDYDIDNSFWWKLTLKTMVKPKPSFCLLIPADESMYRSSLKDEPFPEEVEVRQQRIDLYMEELKKNRWDYVIDATKSIDEVFADIKEKLVNE